MKFAILVGRFYVAGIKFHIKFALHKFAYNSPAQFLLHVMLPNVLCMTFTLEQLARPNTETIVFVGCTQCISCNKMKHDVLYSRHIEVVGTFVFVMQHNTCLSLFLQLMCPLNILSMNLCTCLRHN